MNIHLKRKYKTFLVVLLSCMLCILFLYKNNQDDKDYKYPSVTVFDKLKIKFSENLEYNVPNEAPIFTITEESFSPEYIDQISSSLGLIVEPFELQDSLTGKTLIYSEEDQYLQITPSKRIVDLKNQVELVELIDTTVKDQDIEELSLNLILETFNQLDKELLKVRNFRKFYMTDDGIEASSPSNNITAITYDFTIGDYRILTSTFEVGTATLMFNNRKQLVSLYVNEPSKIQRKGTVNIKSLDKIQKDSEDIQLQSLDEGKIDILKIPEDYITSALITRIEIAYYEDIISKSNILEPVLVLSGVASTRNGNVEVIYTMKATD